LDRADGLCLLDKLLAQSRKSQADLQPSEQELERLLIERDVPTRDDLQKLIQQLDTLAAKLDEISKNTK
jgi:hypothetical protein